MIQLSLFQIWVTVNCILGWMWGICKDVYFPHPHQAKESEPSSQTDKQRRVAKWKALHLVYIHRTGFCANRLLCTKWETGETQELLALGFLPFCLVWPNFWPLYNLSLVSIFWFLVNSFHHREDCELLLIKDQLWWSSVCSNWASVCGSLTLLRLPAGIIHLWSNMFCSSWCMKKTHWLCT